MAAMKRRIFKKIGRQLFFGFVLIYVAAILASGTEFVVRRSILISIQHHENLVNTLGDVVSEIKGVTAELQARQHADSPTEAESWSQEELANIKAQLEANYATAIQLARDDPQAVALLQTARDHSARWFSAVLSSTPRTAAEESVLRRRAHSRQSRSSREDSNKIRLQADIVQTHNQLSDHLRAHRQSFISRIHALSTQADRFLLVVLASAFLFVAVLSAYLPHVLGKRVHRLVQATKDLEAGRYVPGLQGYPEDEFDELAQAFDRMACVLKEKEVQLQQSLRELEAVNKTRERIVDERTSQLRAVQEELIRKEKLSMLGTLSGSIGHELRNPLSVMAASVYFLERVLPAAEGKIKKHLEMLMHQISAANRIITNLLDFARTKEPHQEEIDLNGLVQEAVRRSVIPPTVQLQMTLCDQPSKVWIDPTQVNQVLLNLISNAVQAMPRGGTLEINVNRDNGFVDVIVADTGCGIAAEHRDKIFQPLFTTKQKGIGLGLAVSKKIVEANDGQIDFHSEVGQGTQFRLRFPALRHEHEATIYHDRNVPSSILLEVGR